MSTLELADEATLIDLETYVGRAKRHDPDGAARLQALPAGPAGVLAAWTQVLPGRGLAHDGLVLGLRTLPLAGVPEPLDLVVPLAALTDRLARRSGTTLPVPPVTVLTTWAGVSPPRSGWVPVASLPAGRVHEVASAGIVEVTGGVPEGAGAVAVAELRARVWGRAVPLDIPAAVPLDIPAAVPVDIPAAGPGAPADGTDEPERRADRADALAADLTIPAGAAFAMSVLGFAGAGSPDPVTVHRAGRWTRLSSPFGYVLAR